MLRYTAPLLLATLARGQMPGSGLSKQTMAASQPVEALKWWEKYIAVSCNSGGGGGGGDDDDGPGPPFPPFPPDDDAEGASVGAPKDMCTSTSNCGSYGRGNLCPANGCADVDPFSSLMFHFVNCSARPSGPTTVSTVERVFTTKLTAAVAAKRYDAFFDFSLALWTSSLDSYIAKLEADKVGYLALTWNDETGATYYSVLVHQPGTQSVVELVSSARPSSVPVEELLSAGSVRYPSAVFSNMGVSTSSKASLLTPLCVSKATSNLSAIIGFYEGAIFSKVFYRQDGAPDNSSSVFLNVGYKSMKGKMAVRFVERPASATSSLMSVAALEAVKFAGHDIVHDNAKNLTANVICGFDKWYDNHYAIDGATASLDDYKAAFDKRGWPYYHAWGGGSGGPENMYVVDPTGDAIQLDSSWKNGPPPGVSGDALMSLCTQGDCKVANRPTPDSCTAALAATCPSLGMKYDACADCVYATKNLATLHAASCINADVVSYCVGA